MKQIRLTRSQVALIDDEDYDKVSQYLWYAHKGKGSNTLYAYAGITKNNKQDTIKMHRLILDLNDSNISVDHINRNGLDNRKVNLRKCSHYQNCFNTIGRKNSSSIYKGVSKDDNKYISQIRINGIKYVLGYYNTQKEAAIVYDAIARYYMKEFAYTNFEEEYIKPLSIEELKEKLKILKKDIKVVDIDTNKEVFRSNMNGVVKSYNISYMTLRRRIKDGKSFNGYKYIRLNYKLKY